MYRQLRLLLLFAASCAWLVNVAGCASDSAAARGAQQGAATGAVSGAVGSMVGALVFGGNVVDAGVRGAVVGGATGATAGAMIGAGQDKAAEERRAEAQRDNAAEFREEIGDDAFNGVVALAECKYPVALANASVAQESKNRDFRLAGLWVETLVLADQQREAEARERFKEIIEQDRKVKTPAQAEGLMRDAMTRLGEIRRENGLPVVCS
jgi:hypothetical protein